VSQPQEIQLTTEPCDHYVPSFSPDGEWIAYHRTAPSGDTQVCKIAAAGGGEIVLTGVGAASTNPSWSPDGNWLCFEKRDSTGYRQLYEIRADGTQESALTFVPADHCSPEYSPDGNWIAFWRRDVPNYRYQVYKVLAAGGPEVLLADSHDYCNMPRWSPDCSLLVYQERDSVLQGGTGVWRLYSVSANGGQETRLTDSVAMHEGPDWFPDGAWIAYEFRWLDRDAYSQLCRVPAGGGEEIQLTFTAAMHESPRVSPDGNWIVCERRGDPYYYRQIYLIPAAGGGEIPLTTNDRANHYSPRWSPDGRWVTYVRNDSNWHLQVCKTQTLTGTPDEPSAQQIGGLVQVRPTLSASAVHIVYHLDRADHVELQLCSSDGRLVRTLVNEHRHPGDHVIRWDCSDSVGSGVVRGVYLLRLRVGTTALGTAKLVIP
jgi:TolB protein